MVTKVCYKCKQELSVDKFHLNNAKKDGYASACKECKSKDDKDYLERNKDKAKIRKHEYYLKNKDEITAKVNCYIKSNRVKHNQWGKVSRVRLKTEMFGYYCDGKIKCKHCGEDEIGLLTIDHVNGGGNKHRKENGINGAGYNFYCLLKRNNYPNGFQVLCWNCQFKKRLKEIAPANPTKRQMQKAAYVRLVKNQCLEQYGGFCPCGEQDKDVLTLDHVNDDGVDHRKQTGTRGFNFYIHLRKNNYPSSPPLQVLCLNCQYVKRNKNEEGESGQTTDNKDAAVLV